MRILGVEFGKKRRNMDVCIEDTHNDKSTDINSKSIDIDDIIKDSLRICYRPYSRYQNYVKQITEKEWSYVGDMQTYSKNDNNMIHTYYLGKGVYGTFLEIMCPSPLYMIAICSLDDAGIYPIEFYSHSNLYKIPHFFSMTCTDDNGREISPGTIIDIAKVKSNGEPKRICSEMYGDLSQHIDGRFRRKEERYYFYESIRLEDHERLSFRTSPDIDITKTRLSMKADLFAKEII